MNDKVIVLHDTDNVGTAIADLAMGDTVEVPGRKLQVTEAVPFGHKVALTAIKAGAAIVKYGESIGVAKQDVASGACVHVHNVESQRGRGDLIDTRKLRWKQPSPDIAAPMAPSASATTSRSSL